MQSTETLSRFDPNWLEGLAVYQDVILEGRVEVRGARDSHQRWMQIAPHLPADGVFLDIGSNFGWFGLEITKTRPAAIVASLEADLRSARVQRSVLASHRHERIALLTRPASVRLLRTWANLGQRFDAALLLSVLHWIPRPWAFLRALGAIAQTLIIEYPDPRETGAGSARIRREIGPLAPFLSRCFPARPIVYLGETKSHRRTAYPRGLWSVGPDPTRGERAEASEPARLALQAIMAGHPSWPPRAWWQNQWERHNPYMLAATAEWSLTPAGLLATPAEQGWTSLQLRKQLARLPQSELISQRQRLGRRWAQMADRFARAWHGSL